MITLLREQLDQATMANQGLADDVRRLTAIREELEAREAEWKKEEQVGGEAIRF